MRAATAFLILCTSGIGMAAAQPNPPSPVPETGCRPDTRETAPPSPPTVGSGPPRERAQEGRELSDRLAESRGVICPPRGVDPDIAVTPPAGGDIKVIPPPGAPGGNPNVQPK